MVVVVPKRLILVSFALLILGMFVYFGPQAYVATTSASRKIPIYSVMTPDKRVAITINCAWDPDRTPDILEVLKRHGVKCTFFLVNTWVNRYPDLARRLVAEGHELGLHSARHPDYTKITRDQARKDLIDNKTLVKETTGVECNLFRAPYGAYDNKTIEVAEELGCLTIQWSIDSLDWKGPTAGQMTDRVVNRMHNGAIVLFHNNGTYTPEALDMILEWLKKRGYRMVTVSELLIKGDYDINHRGQQVPKNPQ
ncbi:MAG: polysaccharide deacetylase family protein [Bacillota bacterium]